MEQLSITELRGVVIGSAHKGYVVGVVMFSLMLAACQKEITVDLPVAARKIVVEGSIEQGLPPVVMLTWSQGYFEPTDVESIENSFIRDASVKVSNGTDTIPLDLVCAADLSPEELELAAALLGFDPAVLSGFNLCLYTSLNPLIFGEVGKTYVLLVDHGDHHLHSETKINELVYLDSLWFRIPNEDPGDSLGFIFGELTDPDTSGNAYRWYAKRINTYPDWVPDEEWRGRQKDPAFIAPIGSVFDDEFFNGLSFEFAYYRGQQPNSAKFDDQNEEAGFFKRGDTVAVRGCVIDRGVFRFIDSFESQVSNQGSPFSVPYNVESNVRGGMGVWAGYGAVYDTVVCN
jgi:hypothetical protein